MDFLTKQRRSSLMSRIRSRGNAATELRFIRLVKAEGITGWRRNRKIFGKPDFVFQKLKLAVFVDGCFWHACPRCYGLPKSNSAFWEKKACRNRERDRLVTRTLRRSGWQVMRIWQHDLTRKNQARLLRRVQRAYGNASGPSTRVVLPERMAARRWRISAR
jgi:DNA mismatch endonuclease (patch repair protein)